MLLAFTVTAFGVLVAVTIKQAQTFTWVMQLVVFPMFFLSGALYPVAGLPAWLEVLNRINPLTYAVDPMRHLVFSHLDVSETARRTLDPGVTWFGWQLPPLFEVGMVLLLGLAMLGARDLAVLADGVNGGATPPFDHPSVVRETRTVASVRPAGAVAPANEEAARAWDTVLYERWKRNRDVFVGALEGMTEEIFDRFPPPAGGRCLDIGCGFGDTTQRLAELAGPDGFALGTDSSPHFIEDARREAAEAGCENVAFEVADAQTAEWDPAYDYAFSRMGTQFFAMPVAAMRAIRGALVPGGTLRKVCWRRKSDSPIWAETEQVVQRFLSRPEVYDADTCGPGPFSLGNPETTRGILEAAGFADIELHRSDFDYYLGRDMDEALEAMLAIGPGAELIRLNGEYGERRRPEITEALADRYAAWQRPDGSVVGGASVWVVTATNPGPVA